MHLFLASHPTDCATSTGIVARTSLAANRWPSGSDFFPLFFDSFALRTLPDGSAIFNNVQI
jgi:hypothetical protein